MSKIPNAREKYCESPYKDSKPEPNLYWEGFQTSKAKSELVGYDFACMAAENFFYNLEAFADIVGDYIDLDKIDRNILISEDKSIRDYTEEELSQMSKETKLIRALGEALLEHLEINRDELNCSNCEAEYEGVIEARKNIFMENGCNGCAFLGKDDCESYWCGESGNIKYLSDAETTAGCKNYEHNLYGTIIGIPED